MKLLLPGGSGQVGHILARAFHAQGHDVTVLSRSPRNGHPWRTLPWDARTPDGPWTAALDDADVVINLAGRSVNCRYTAANRRAILESRVDSTRAIAQAIARSNRPPRVWLQMSTATIYAHRHDAPNDDVTGVVGGHEPGAPSTWNFSIDVATDWEHAVAAAETPRTRKVLLRAAMVMSPDRGGVFDVLLALVRRGLGGRAGDGRQFVSWIHHRDFVRAAEFLIARDDLAGPINLAAPAPLPNAEFMRALRETWGTRAGLPSPKWLLEIGTFLMRTESELVLKSRRVTPKRLTDAGFTFDFPDWPAAARDLVTAWRAARG